MKLKRLLTGVLSAVMALSVCAMPALADEAAATPKKGSLTITKYEQDSGKTDYDNDGKGTLLKGVEFRIYKIATAEQKVDATTGTVSMEYTLVDSLKNRGINFDDSKYIDSDNKGKIDSKILYDDIRATLSNADITALKPKTETTGDDGKATFKDLDLGIYMVEEVKAPAQITSLTASFVVAIPMMEDNGTWNYNVEAKPKNVSTYGGVSLVKYGKIAGANGEGTPLQGAKFHLDRNTGTEDAPTWTTVDLSATGITVTGGVLDETIKGSDGNVTTPANGTINIDGLTPGIYRFKEISAPAGYVVDTKTEYIFRLDKDRKVYIGDSEQKNKTVSITNEKPDFKKEITKRDGKTSTNNDADYGVGDKVPYTLTVTVPSAIGNMKTFYVTDAVNLDTTKPQLKYDESSFNVTCSDGTTIKKDINYTIVFNKKTEDGTDTDTGFTIDFKKGTTGLDESFAGKTIVIKYKAELLADAVTTNAGNVNKAELVYSNKTNVGSDGEEQDSDKNTIHDEGVVYTFQAGILKQDPKSNKLTGVEFALYKKYDSATDGSIGEDAATIHFTGTDCKIITGDTAKNLGLDDTAKWIEVKANEKTDENGNILVKGLPAGEYYWVETKALDGYNLLKEPVKANLNVTYKAGWTEEKEYKDGVLTKHEYKMSETTYPTREVSTPITIVNRKGFTLPVTGGFGTLLFSGIGVLLVLAGVCVLFSMKKKNNRA